MVLEVNFSSGPALEGLENAPTAPAPYPGFGRLIPLG